MNYTNETATNRLGRLLLLKGISIEEIEKTLDMSHRKIIDEIIKKDYGVIGNISEALGGGMINQYFHTPEGFDIFAGEIVPCREEPRS